MLEFFLLYVCKVEYSTLTLGKDPIYTLFMHLRWKENRLKFDCSNHPGGFLWCILATCRKGVNLYSSHSNYVRKRTSTASVLCKVGSWIYIQITLETAITQTGRKPVPVVSTQPIQRQIFNQICQTAHLTNRDADMWLSVNESVLNLIWILSGYKTPLNLYFRWTLCIHVSVSGVCPPS